MGQGLNFPRPGEWEGQDAGVPGQGDPSVSIHEPGGEFVRRLLHPSLTVFEREYQTLAEEAWFKSSLTPRHPVQFELGSFTVPKGLTLVLTEASMGAFRFSGIDPGGTVEVENKRLYNNCGFDLLINNTRYTNAQYQLDPEPVVIAQPSFTQPQTRVAATAPVRDPRTGASLSTGTAPPYRFQQAASRSFGNSASSGLALQPFRGQPHPGPMNMPFSLIATEGNVVTLRAVIFRSISIPITSLTGRLAGIIGQVQAMSSILNRVRPR